MDASSIALQGIQQADALLNAAGSQLATAGANSPNGADLNVVDLSSDIVSLISAQTLYEANVDTLKTANQMKQRLLNVMG